MRPLSAPELLDVWEHGQGLRPIDQAMTLLVAACLDQSLDSLAALSIGERDAQLMRLRQWAFGDQITSIAECPDCGMHVELEFGLADLNVGPSDRSPLTLETDNWTILFRP